STPAGGTFSWTNSNTAIGIAASGTGDIPAFTATNTGTSPIMATVTVIPIVNSCPGTPSSYTIAVNPTPTVTVPANITICNNGNVPASNFTSTPTGGTFTWTNSNTAIGLSANGSGDIAAFTASNSGTSPISATITVTPFVNNCTGIPSTYTITVNPSPTVTVPADITVCNNGSVITTNFTSTPTGGTFSWTNSNTTIGLSASGSGDIASFTAINIGVSPISATITVVPSVNNCTGAPSTYTITVNPTPTVTVPANITICNNDTVPATNFTSTPAGGTFSWINSNTAIGLSASGTGDIVSFTATNTGTSSISATITVTPSVNNCNGTPSTYTITVNPTPTVIVPANITVCNNGSVPSTNFTSTPAGGTFSWTNSNTAIGLSASGSGDIASFTATNTGTSPISATITVTPDINNCSGTPSTYTITVNPSPGVTVPADITVCNNGSVTASNFTSTPAGGTFSWTNSNTAIGLAANGTGNIASFNATNTGTSPISATITVTPTVNNCSGAFSTYIITVNPTPTVTVPSNITLCNNSSVAATNFTSIPAGGTFTWTNSNTAIGLGSAGTGNIATFTATNTGSTPISGTITVAPSLNNCPGINSTYTITVNPTPSVSVTADVSVCSGETVPATAFTSNTPGCTFAWTNSNTAIGLYANGTGNIAAFTATNTGTEPITATITVTPSANGCPGTASTYNITVNPIPSVASIANITSCSGDTIPAITFTSLTTGTTFAWTNSNTAIGIASSGTGDIPSFIVTNAGTVAITSTISVLPTANNCTGTPSAFTIIVNPLPVVTFGILPQLCVTSPLLNLSQASPSGGTYSGPGVTGNTFDPAAAGIGTHTLTYEYTLPSTGCNNSASSQIVITSGLTITVTPDHPSYCDGGNVLLTAEGAYNYSWQPNTGISPNTGANVVASPLNTTTYTVIGTNPDGCAGSATVTVMVYHIPLLSITPVPEDGCSPLEVTFGYIPAGIIDTNSLSWNFGDPNSANNTSTATAPSHLYIDHGTYPVNLSAQTIEGCPVSAADTVIAYKKPVADFIFNPEFAYTDNGRIDFINLTTGVNAWTWNFGDPASYNDNYSGLLNPYHIYTDSGTYTVQLIVYSSQNCSDTLEKPLVVLPSIIIFIPNAFTADNDLLNDIWKPEISGIDKKTYELYIYDRWGMNIFYTDDIDQGWNGTYKGKKIEAGVYVYYIVYRNLMGKLYKYRGTVTLVR
ncbi:MAG TPA: gliding motility-associated C-terminal domain-containing protein, partial [Bacteroidales bacterium]|nr:gliding motility-associated C-terminal domain-containing protein [Bacteroidales bacterium]